MPSVEYDLGYLETAVDLLEKYLLSNEIYWKMMASSPPGEAAYPSLTLGGLLLAQARSQARQLTPGQTRKLTQLVREIEQTKAKWQTAWENKAQDEFRARLNLWRDFLEEFRQDPDENKDRFSYEVSRRVMLHLLTVETSEIPNAEQQMLAGLDAILSGLFVPGEFIWSADLSAGFPEKEYPYLYGKLRG
jgi:hypothetical protein